MLQSLEETERILDDLLDLRIPDEEVSFVISDEPKQVYH